MYTYQHFHRNPCVWCKRVCRKKARDDFSNNCSAIIALLPKIFGENGIIRTLFSSAINQYSVGINCLYYLLKSIRVFCLLSNMHHDVYLLELKILLITYTSDSLKRNKPGAKNKVDRLKHLTRIILKSNFN